MANPAAVAEVAQTRPIETNGRTGSAGAAISDRHATRDDFRAVMSRWCSGVTVITARHGEHSHGMVASSFTSVSADPLTVLFCADRATRTYQLVKQAGAFAVNILGEAQEETFRVFTGQKGPRDGDRFAEEEIETAATGAPVLSKSLAWFDCRVVAEYPGGTTHSIVIGEVVAAGVGEDADPAPLAYFHRALRRLAVTGG